jgi:hypothetical protein
MLEKKTCGTRSSLLEYRYPVRKTLVLDLFAVIANTRFSWTCHMRTEVFEYIVIHVGLALHVLMFLHTFCLRIEGGR